METEHWIAILMCANCFVAGTQFSEFEWDEPIAWGYMALALVIGFAVVVLWLCIALWTWLRDGLLVRGWFLLWFTKRFDNMKTETLDGLASICKNHFNGKSLHDRMYRTQVKSVFRRNGYKSLPTNTTEG